MSAKELEWLPHNPPDTPWKCGTIAYISILKINNKPAYYTVERSNHVPHFSAVLWYGNGFDAIEWHCESLKVGQALCQLHFNKLISQNSE